jgi:hypothetical protein
MNSPFDKSNIWCLICCKITGRTDLSMQYGVPHKRPFWLFGSVRIKLGDRLTRRNLIKHPDKLRLLFHQTAMCLYSIRATPHGHPEIPESSESSM